jgi:hypothetical protein
MPTFSFELQPFDFRPWTFDLRPFGSRLFYHPFLYTLLYNPGKLGGISKRRPSDEHSS